MSISKTPIKQPVTTGRSATTLPRGERMRRPSHPGAVLREIILPGRAISQTELAVRLDVSRRSINMILNEQRRVTVDMALRLARLFNTSAAFWLNLQQALDTWEASQQNGTTYQRIEPLPRAA